MTPDQFPGRLKRDTAPAYLFLGSESFQRAQCKTALLDAVLPPEERENGLTRYDLKETPLIEIIDDARSLSLFADRRLIIVGDAEAALPRQKSDDEGDSDPSSGDVQPLSDYLKDPSPGVTILFEAVRYSFEGDDKKKLERVRKFYSVIPDVVELRPYSMADARLQTLALIHRAGIEVDRAGVELLLEALNGDVARIQIEIEKLSLYAGAGGRVSIEDIGRLVPDARAANIFALVGALGRRDRRRSLQILESLIREGEYIPLALAFLSTQFRMALVAKEAGLRGASQVQGYFTRLGMPMWGSRADQVFQTVSKFSKEQLELGLKMIFQTDRDLRDTRPDDRIVLERFILELTA
jgi:DNA polymerase-3 subunit delta